jgi:hypothetical protein
MLRLIVSSGEQEYINVMFLHCTLYYNYKIHINDMHVFYVNILNFKFFNLS